MKKLIFLLMGFFIWQSALSQGNSHYQNEFRILALNLTGPVNQAKIQNRAYTASTVDTTEWIRLADFVSVLVSLQSKDSCTLLIAYQLSLDESKTPGLKTTLDSLSTAQNAGDVKTLNFSTTSLGAAYGRFIFSGSAAARPEGTTSATYTATALFKKY